MEAKLDYWEFTVPYDQGEELLDLFPGGWEFRKNDRGDIRGWRGYTHSADLAVGSGIVGWSPEDRRMGVHSSLSGEALHLLAGNGEAWSNLPGMLSRVHDGLDGHTTRVDVAFDDLVGLLDLGVIGRHLEAGLFVSRWKNWQYIKSSKSGIVGETYYLGSGRSDTQLRIYDKRCERLQKGHEVEEEHWIRVELQLRRKRAHAVGERLKEKASGVWEYLAGVVRGMVEFKEEGTSPQKTRWKPADWWLTFLGHVEKARLVVEKQVRTLDSVKAYLWNQTAPSIALLEKGMGFDEAWAFMYQVAQDGHGRLRPKHKLILAASRGKNGKSGSTGKGTRSGQGASQRTKRQARG